MKQIPGLTAAEANIVINCIPKDLQVKIFGSRVNNRHRQNSDLDICILSQVSRSQMAEITEAFEESNLPFTVDIISYLDCDAKFRKIIDETGIKL